MSKKSNDQLTPAEVRKMPLDEFEKRFGFRPIDALDKWGFAGMGKRMDALTREMITTGVLDTPNLDDIVME